MACTSFSGICRSRNSSVYVSGSSTVSVICRPSVALYFCSCRSYCVFYQPLRGKSRRCVHCAALRQDTGRTLQKGGEKRRPAIRDRRRRRPRLLPGKQKLPPQPDGPFPRPLRPPSSILARAHQHPRSQKRDRHEWCEDELWRRVVICEFGEDKAFHGRFQIRPTVETPYLRTIRVCPPFCHYFSLSLVAAERSPQRRERP